MRITETVFDKCLVLEPDVREDIRGSMEVFYNDPEIKDVLNGFELTEQRIYKMPANSFFGIHKGPSKLISIIQGKGLDYLIDLRKDSETYKQYKTVELSGDVPKLVYVPAGFGHAFIALEDNTIQAFALDTKAPYENSRSINYMSSGIELKLPVDNVLMADYDKNAQMLE